MSDVETPHVESDGAQANGSENSSIEVHGVTKRFGPVTAVDGLTFNVKKGEVVGLLGPNGSGKTTTMRLLTSFYTPDGGNILINGTDTQEDDTTTRGGIGYLPENNPLYEDLLVREYLSFVADLRGMSPAERRENMDRTVDEMGIAEVYNRPIGELSKGYHQRVGLAQAILHRPSVLILDEPTEGLDPNQRISIRGLVKALGQDRTVLLSTHVMQEVESTCERVLVISRGRLVADSTVQDLLKGAEGMRTVSVEIEGDQVETGLRGLPNVDSVERQDAVAGRKRYVVSVVGEQDPRPDIFRLAKARDWVLWELHEESARMEDVFHSLTAERSKSD